MKAVQVSTKMLALVLVAGAASFACSSSKSGADAAGANTGDDAAAGAVGEDAAAGGAGGTVAVDAALGGKGGTVADDAAAGGKGAADGSVAGSTGDGGSATIATSSGVWTIYPEPYGPDAGANPFSTVSGTVVATAVAGGKMHVSLSVTGLPPGKTYGSHIHKLACADNKAGTHYQNNPLPPDASATDPTYANNVNEVWLDFTTDANGKGMAETMVNWVPRAGEANAVVIHNMATADGGVAGAKLACTDMKF